MRQTKSLKIREDEIIEKFIRSQGPGGQHVNKTSSCVYLKHIPTGLEIKCQEERSQVRNRYLARRLLAEKIAAQKSAELLKKKNIEEKLKRKNRKKSKQAKLKILENKRKHSEKKRLRFKTINLE